MLVQIIFFIIAALIISAAIMVVSVRNIIHAALWLITSFFGVGALYLLLEAEFLAIVQVLIYVGAVSVLVLFAIMLTRHITGEGERQLYKHWWVGLIIAGVLFAAVLTPTLLNQDWNTIALAIQPEDVTEENEALLDTLAEQASDVAGTRELGFAFMQEYLLPFQAAAVLLLVALVGAIVIAYEERTRSPRTLTLAERLALQRQQQSPPSQQAEGSSETPNTEES
jgi:NADH-quinone oxidoreductase subunit J